MHQGNPTALKPVLVCVFEAVYTAMFRLRQVSLGSKYAR